MIFLGRPAWVAVFNSFEREIGFPFEDRKQRGLSPAARLPARQVDVGRDARSHAQSHIIHSMEPGLYNASGISDMRVVWSLRRAKQAARR